MYRYRPIIGFADMGKSLSVSVIGIGRYRMPYRQPYRYTHKHQSEVNSAGTRWRFYSRNVVIKSKNPQGGQKSDGALTPPALQVWMPSNVHLTL